MGQFEFSRRSFLASTSAAIAAWTLDTARAQAGIIRVIVPFPPGGTADPVGRAVKDRLAARLNRTAIVDNLPGGGSIVGTVAVARAAPDGLTIGMAAGPFVLNAALRSGTLPYNTEKDFAPITRHLRMPLVLAVHPDVPARNVRELVKYARDRADKFALAIPAPGTFGDIASRQFKSLAKLDATLVPYKGGGAAVVDLIGGHVSAMFETLGTINTYAQAGKLRIIAVASAARMPILPDVETMAEAGYRDFDYAAFFGWIAPAGTPAAILQNYAGIINGLSENEKADLIAQGFELVPDSPSQFADALRADIQRWRAAVKHLGIVVE